MTRTIETLSHSQTKPKFSPDEPIPSIERSSSPTDHKKTNKRSSGVVYESIPQNKLRRLNSGKERKARIEKEKNDREWKEWRENIQQREQEERKNIEIAKQEARATLKERRAKRSGAKEQN